MSVRILVASLVAFGALTTVAGAQVQPTGGRAVWKADGDQVGAGLGCAVASAGDVNGDGFDDVLVGAYRFDDTLSDQGRAAVFHGSGPAGRPRATSAIPTSATPWRARAT